MLIRSNLRLEENIPILFICYLANDSNGWSDSYCGGMSMLFLLGQISLRPVSFLFGNIKPIGVFSRMKM